MKGEVSRFYLIILFLFCWVSEREALTQDPVARNSTKTKR